MQEKDMVMDILTGTKSSIGSYAKIITECANPTLRQTFQQMRDGDEQFQYDLFKLAEKKGYYKPSANVSPEEINQVKSNLINSDNQNTISSQSNNNTINIPYMPDLK